MMMMFGVFNAQAQTIGASTTADSQSHDWYKGVRLLRTIPRYDSTTAIAFAPDGQTIVSGSRDHILRLWSPEGGLLKTLEGHAGVITSVAFSPDGQTIVSGSYDRTLKVWGHPNQ